MLEERLLEAGFEVLLVILMMKEYK